MQNFIQNALSRWCWKSLLCEQHVKQEDKLFEKNLSDRSSLGDIQNYNFVCCFVWVRNLVVDIAGGKEAEGVWEHGVEENICT